ncbi:MAG: GTP-binding protein [Propionibacteriaceae bacterium]
MHLLNLGIVAHVDAGKTSLTERLLYAAGVIDRIGSVDDGSTQTDTLALERRRGITIKSAVVSFVVGDVTVNLIDTPGHPDFIAEVERVLSVLDGAVLVVSAVEGVQAQTGVLMRTLIRLKIPTLIFVNKLDRSGADPARVLQSMISRLDPGMIAMDTASDLGTQAASSHPFGLADTTFTARLLEQLAEHDESLLAAYVDDDTHVSYRRLRTELATQTRQTLVHPVFSGSAITGAGVDALTAGIAELLPVPIGDPGGPARGTVFKIERNEGGQKLAYVRMFTGTLRIRDRVRFGGRTAKITGISVFSGGTTVDRSMVRAGQIGKISGLTDVQIGDVIGPVESTGAAHYFAPPALETVVLPVRATDRGGLHLALSQLAEQDPLINVRQDDLRQEISVSLYGEVQKEVIASTLADDFGIEVIFRATTTICIERPTGIGSAVERIKDEGNPFLATVGLRIEPAPVDSGVEFRLEVERGAMPPAFFRAVEETVRATLHQGLYGWQVTDCVVTMTHSGYCPRQSHAHAVFDKSMSSSGRDFRQLTPLVLLAALRLGGSTVCEPIQRFHLEVPADAVEPLLPLLARLGGVTRVLEPAGSSFLLEGEIPAAQVHVLQLELPVLSHGEGLLEASFDHYLPVRGERPTRSRTDHNPLDRNEYLLQVERRVQLSGSQAR